MSRGRLPGAVAALVTMAAAIFLPGLGPALAQGTTASAVAAAPAEPEPRDQASNGDVRVELAAVGPTALTPDGTLTVRATVHNGTAQPLSGVAVQLWVRQQRSSTRAALEEWVEGDIPLGSVERVVPVPQVIPPGGSHTVDLSVPAHQLDLPSSPFQWGPRGLAVELLDAANGRLDITRSFFVWQPEPGGYEPTPISVVVPLTDGTPDIQTGTFPQDRLERLTSADGRLRAVLQAASLPGVTWFLDPALLGTGEVDADPAGSADGGTGDPGTPASGAGGTTATTPGPGPSEDGEPVSDQIEQWRQALRQAASGHEIVALPYADPDVNALAHAGLDRIYELAEKHGRDTVQQALDVPARTDVAWPASGTLDADTLTMLVDAGRSSIVLSGGAQPPSEVVGYTTTGRSRIVAGTTSAAGLLVDTPLSTTLAALGDQPQEPGQPPEPGGAEEDQGPVATVQRLLAETAAITLERPFDPRHVLVTAPRDWDPEPAAAVSAVRALTTAPWLDARPLRDLIDNEPADVERGGLRYPESDREAELPASGLRRVAAALDRVKKIATVLEDPDRAVRAAERSAAAASSVAWRKQVPQWREQVEEFAASTAARAMAVHVLPGSGITVVSSNVSLPVTLENTLDQDAMVQVRLRPQSSRLVVDNDVVGTVTVPAHSQERVSVPVQALGNGNTDVTVQVLTPTGEPLGAPVVMTVRVRADWETRGTLVLGVLIGLVLLVGLVRGIRRGRRQSVEHQPAAKGQPENQGQPEEQPAEQQQPDYSSREEPRA